jgi:hypothetical protein
MEGQRDRFYKGIMDREEAKRFLKKYNTSYVYYGYQEKYQGSIINYIGFLKPIFSNTDATVYQVIY